MQGVYGYGMDIGIIEPELPAAPLNPEASPATFPPQYHQTTPAAPSANLQLGARGMHPQPSRKQVLSSCMDSPSYIMFLYQASCTIKAHLSCLALPAPEFPLHRFARSAVLSRRQCLLAEGHE